MNFFAVLGYSIMMKVYNVQVLLKHRNDYNTAATNSANRCIMTSIFNIRNDYPVVIQPRLVKTAKYGKQVTGM